MTDSTDADSLRSLPYAGRAYRRLALWMFALFILVNLANLMLPARGLGIVPRAAWYGLPGLMLMLVGLWFVAVVLWERRLLARLRQAGHRLCPSCGYALAGHEGQVTCPECGTPCDLDEIRDAWRRYVPRISGRLWRS